MNFAVSLSYPTSQHAAAAAAVTEFFAGRKGVSTVLLFGSTARGKAAPSSCLDFYILLQPAEFEARRAVLEQQWRAFYPAAPVFKEMLQWGRYAHVDLEFGDGVYDPQAHDHGWTTGPDEFELQVGNYLAYSVALWQGDGYFQDLRAQWLPYYGAALRRERLQMVLGYLYNNLDHIPAFVARGLYFQSFNRLYDAYREFLQALFISRCTYPIAYDKWIREQIVDILGLPELYLQLPRLFEISQFESQAIAEKAEDLRGLVAKYVGG